MQLKRQINVGYLNINIRRVVAFIVLVAFIVTSVPLAYAQGVVPMSAPGSMVPLSENVLVPSLKGLKVYPDNPFRFDFLLDEGNFSGSAEHLKAESARLVRYFLATLTIPEKDLWVNLSPYEKDRIIPEAFGQTEMGRDLLAQDYVLKQVTASLLYPEGQTGKAFWARIYAEASAKYGTMDIPVDTFNKVWIMPDKAVVDEYNGMAFVVEGRLKVMLESDYAAMSHQKDMAESSTPAEDVAATQNEEMVRRGGVPAYRQAGVTLPLETGSQEMAKQILREIIIPILEKEVNEGKNFATLRQVYHSLILAAWYKRKVKESLLGKVYVDRQKIAGVDIADKTEKQQIYARYLEAFRKGVYNFIKEEQDPVTQEMIPRKYFSGGEEFTGRAMDPALQVRNVDAAGVAGDMAGKNFSTIVVALKPTGDFAAKSPSDELDHVPIEKVQGHLMTADEFLEQCKSKGVSSKDIAVVIQNAGTPLEVGFLFMKRGWLDISGDFFDTNENREQFQVFIEALISKIRGHFRIPRQSFVEVKEFNQILKFHADTWTIVGVTHGKFFSEPYAGRQISRKFKKQYKNDFILIEEGLDESFALNKGSFFDLKDHSLTKYWGEPEPNGIDFYKTFKSLIRFITVFMRVDMLITIFNATFAAIHGLETIHFINEFIYLLFTYKLFSYFPDGFFRQIMLLLKIKVPSVKRAEAYAEFYYERSVVERMKFLGEMSGGSGKNGEDDAREFMNFQSSLSRSFLMEYMFKLMHDLWQNHLKSKDVSNEREIFLTQAMEVIHDGKAPHVLFDRMKNYINSVEQKNSSNAPEFVSLIGMQHLWDIEYLRSHPSLYESIKRGFKQGTFFDKEYYEAELRKEYGFAPRVTKKASTPPTSIDPASIDQAQDMKVTRSTKLIKGGIDLNTDKLDIQLRHSGGDIKFNIDPAMLERLQAAAGFTPVIMAIKPEGLARFLGVKTGSTGKL